MKMNKKETEKYPQKVEVEKLGDLLKDVDTKLKINSWRDFIRWFLEGTKEEK